MFKRATIMVFGLVFAAPLLANQTGDQFPAFKEYARSLNAQSLNALRQFNPQTTFKDYTTNPEQKTLYHGVTTKKTDLTAQSAAALKTDPGGQEVMKHTGDHQFAINKTTDAIKHAQLIEEESYTIVHGKSNQRIHCDETPKACELKSHVETCQTSRALPPQTCLKELQVRIDEERINQRADASVVVAKKWTGVITVNLVTGVITNAAGGHTTNLVKLQHPCASMSATIHALTNAGKPADWVEVTGVPSCSNNGLLSLYITRKFNRAYFIDVALTVNAKSQPYLADEHWDNGCASLETPGGLCHLLDERCTKPASTHVIHGLPVTRDCWEKTATFVCASAKTQECKAQKAKQCLQLSSRCLRREQTGCAVYEQRYTCFDKVCPAPVVCIKDLFCADGECSDAAGTQNDEFGQSITPLAVVGEAGREYAQTQAALFSGKVVRCNRLPLDIIDCCSDKGWGKKIDILHCPKEDQDLGRAKLNYLAHYVGEYCAKKVAGVCIKRKRTYCVFGTKMARIIQEEGRLKQLNPKALGTAKKPTCGGMSVQDLQALDMGRMEFLKPDYPFGSGIATEAAGIAVLPPDTSTIHEEAIRRIKQRVGG